MEIELLKAGDIECRIGQLYQTGCTLLLYKDARCDMRILDKLFGPTNWKREHVFIGNRLYCNVSIWDESKHEWITKQDVGTESNTEPEKGQASDAFKRACFNWGIGRELYTAPRIAVRFQPSDVETTPKLKCLTSFYVREIGYDNQRRINHLVIVDRKGNVRYTLGQAAAQPKAATQPQPQPQQPQQQQLNFANASDAEAKTKGGKTMQETYTDVENAKDIFELNAVWNASLHLAKFQPFIDKVLGKMTSFIFAAQTVEELGTLWKNAPHLQAYPAFKEKLAQRKQDILTIQ